MHKDRLIDRAASKPVDLQRERLPPPGRGGAGSYAGGFLLAAQGPGQRFERGVCPVPRRIEVATIKRNQRARGFEDRFRLI